jgi:hypothetical protein
MCAGIYLYNIFARLPIKFKRISFTFKFDFAKGLAKGKLGGAC